MTITLETANDVSFPCNIMASRIFTDNLSPTNVLNYFNWYPTATRLFTADLLAYIDVKIVTKTLAFNIRDKCLLYLIDRL